MQLKVIWCPFFCSAILREEVKYVHTDRELMIMEKTARGKKDIVLGYIIRLGTPGIKRNGKSSGYVTFQ